MPRSRFVIKAIESFLNPHQSNEWLEKHERETVLLEKEHETRIAQIKHDHADEIAKVKRDHETQIMSLTQKYGDEIAQVRREAERKDNNISELQSNNDMELALLRANLGDLRNQLGFMQHEYVQLRLLLSAPKQSFWGGSEGKRGN